MKTASKKSASTDELDFKDHHLVFSHIRHNVRRKFEISINVYLVLDMIYTLSRNGLCTLDKDTIAFEIGVNRDTVYQALKIGKEKKLISQPQKRGGYKTTLLWDNAIKEDDAWTAPLLFPLMNTLTTSPKTANQHPAHSLLN